MNALPTGYALHEYRIEKVLGVGGFGLTYLALDANLNLRVALKEYLPGDIALRGPDQSITGGVIIVITIFGLNRLVAEARVRIPMVQRLLESKPTEIGRDGTWFKDALEEQGVDEEDVGAAIREHGLERVEQMKLAVLEEDGSISIVPADGEDNPSARRRRRRYKRRAF